ncbi:CHAT domain-containing protein [Catenuloplanes indicus]|uniref:Tetratricopeptide (TPR) repeat protein n=1 Tax=Catenuloplanes indicus TaxID=137267 RepID=A0AAE4AYD8_9ACTN|nr:CHAT domain-containing protein [Catenuloplanes indicus]MDQ0364938.1 tetratricopeptide (TPR) repeat protein [Catenuloplanes indicus]
MNAAEEALTRYEEDGDLATLTEAIGELRALAVDDGEEERLWWRHQLARAYAERGGRTGSADDWQAAIDAFSLVVSGLLPGPLRAENLLLLIDAHWQRARTVCFGPAGPGPLRPEDEARRALAEIDRARAGIDDPGLLAHVRLPRGLLLLVLFDLAGERAHLDQGIDDLTAALDTLAPDLPDLVLAGALLCDCLRRRAWLDEDPASFDAAIAAGLRADTLAVDPDDPALPMLHEWLAEAFRDRWETGAAPADLDAAIARYERLLAVAPETRVACGRLLRERAEIRGTVEDAGRAVALLDGSDAWYDLARAHVVRWQQGHAPEDLDRADAYFDRALHEAAAASDDDQLMEIHTRRLLMTNSRIEAESAADPHVVPPGARIIGDRAAEARAVFDRSGGTGDPDTRAMLATVVALSEMRSGVATPESVDMDRITALMRAGHTISDPTPEWQRLLDSADALTGFAAAARTSADPAPVVAAAVRAMTGPGTTADISADARKALGMALMLRALNDGDRRAWRASTASLVESDDPDLRVMSRAMDLIDRARRDGLGAADDVRRFAREVRDAGPNLTVQQTVLPLIGLFEDILDGADGTRSFRLGDSPLREGDTSAAADALMAVTGPLIAARTRHDPRVLRECLRRLGEIRARVPDGHRLRPVIAGLGMTAAQGLARNGGDPADAALALHWSSEAVAQSPGVYTEMYAQVRMGLAEAIRMTGGDRAESRRLGLTAVHGHAAQVLLQSGTDDAVAAAGEAAATAMRVAAWCRQDGATGDLVAALDAGRGLVLQAATASRTIPDRLVAAGRPDLAERWRTTDGYGSDEVTGALLGAVSGGPEAPDALRAEVFRALDVREPQPVTPAELRAALTAAGADALVYLTPATAEQTGAAVVVPVTGEVVTLDLPGLAAPPGSLLARFAAADARSRARGRRTRPGPGRDAEPDDDGGPPLEEVCRWAWAAAAGPLLRHTARWSLRRPVRLVLIPMGILALVPWHAARHGGRYLVHDAVVSYAVSARAFTATAHAPVRPVRSALVVGDPAGNLPFAGLEARAIREAFYPGGVYLGGTDGTPDRVLDWVAAAAPGPSLLHLACHGRADRARPAEARLELAGGALTARRLLDASRTAELSIERVFLAACATGITGTAHDEAFSLASTFLAAGTRTVFGSLWEVPDAETSLLMYLIHHHLEVAGREPADALHAAQLWMLDPHRLPLPGMPPALASRCAGPRAADPVSWAAFTHQGR